MNLEKTTNTIHHINRLKEKSYYHLNLYRKTIDKIQYPFMIF